MNIAIVSNTASFHRMAQLLSKESMVYHYGANASLSKTDSYTPIPIDIHSVHMQREMGRRNIESEINEIIEDVKNRKIDFLLARGSPDLSYNERIQQSLASLNIPYFFCNRKCADLEYNKFKTKQILQELDIPTGTTIDGQVTGQFLFDNFYEIKRPFVVKSYQYQYGRQTTIVNDENFEEVYLDLFSKKLGIGYRITNINDEWDMIIEKFVNIKKELSCHYLVNNASWKYIGSGRDYKKVYEGDKGHNTLGLGAYNVNEIDNRIHEYADKICNYLKMHDYQYKGFLFLGIAIDENDVPMILEINTRPGDPEINVILGSISNNLTDLLFAAGTDTVMPDVVHNNNKVVSIRLVDTNFNWKDPATRLPNLTKVPDNIAHSLEGGESRLDFSLTHSLFTASADTYENASKEIYNYLSNQDLGQYRYRSDIGILI